MMFRTLIKKELLQQVHTQKFVILTVVSICLLMLGIYVAAERYDSKTKEYERAVGLHEEILGKLRTMTKETMQDSGMDSFDSAVFRRPTPLSIFCLGKEDDLGDVGRIEPLRTPFMAQSLSKMGFFNEFDLTEALGRTMSRIDFTMVVRVLFSLMAVFIAFDMVTGERENGTLKIVHSNYISRRRVITSKWISGAAVLASGLLAALLISLLYLTAVKGIVFTAGESLRLLFLFLLSLLYILCFYQTALLISCAVRSSHVSIVSMFLIWAVSLFIVPNISVMLGKSITPIPATDYLSTAEREIGRKYDVMKQPGKSREETQNIYKREYQETWQIQLEFLNRLREQRRTAVLLSLISPAPVYDFASEIAAGTTIDDHFAFMDGVRAVNELFTEKFNSFPDGKESFESRKNFTIDLVAYVSGASRADHRLSFRGSMVRALPYMAWLILVNGLLFTLAVLYYDRRTRLI
jgi:ABC-type transport system involved in multi-copper enzyme maturation permease subunit